LPKPRKIRKQALIALLILAIGGAAIGIAARSGGSHGSAKAFCSALASGSITARSEYQALAEQKDPWADLQALASAPGQISVWISGLQAAAPAAIEPAVSKLSLAVKAETAAWNADQHDRIKLLFESTRDGVRASRAIATISSWTEANCSLP
jgi:hypothetical protein